MPVGVGGAGLVAVGVPGVVHWCVHGCGEAQVGGEGAGFGIVAGGCRATRPSTPWLQRGRRACL